VKRLLLLLLVHVLTSPLTAQKNLPAPGKIDKADLEMKDCDFDKGAVAVTLIEWGNVYYDRGIEGVSFLNTIYEKRERIKILKESGLAYADVSIQYLDNNNEEKILKLEAYTYNLDDAGNIKVTEVSKSSIYSKRINKYFSKMIIAFPEVKVGTVIEYKYKMERKTDQNLKSWFFQDRIPTRYSEYQINIPKFYRFSVQPTVVDSIEVKEEMKDELISTNKGSLSTQVLKKNFIMRNLIGIKDEPFMGSPRDYQQRLEFQLSQVDYGDGNVLDLRMGWSDILHDLKEDNDFGKQLEWAPSNTEALITEAAGIKNQEARMKLIYTYVRKNMSWNGDEDIYSGEGINAALKKHEGNSADINLLLVCLLKKANLEAAPILLSTRENGLVNKHYPFLKQFNTVMAYVKLQDKYFILDGTDKVSNYTLTPESIVNTQGFIAEGEAGEWLDIIDQRHKYKVMAAVHGEIDSAGIMKGEALVNCNGYARKQRCDNYVKNKDNFKATYFSSANTALKIDELLVNNVEADSLPLEQKVKFSALLNNSGNYSYFNVNLFSDLDKNPFVADDRMADIDFGFLQEYTMFGNYTIPQDYVFEELPANFSMIMPDTSIIFTRNIQADENLLNVRMTVEFKRTFYPVSEYPEFAAFYKKLFTKLNEQIVIKKKTTP
jgi:hypothetical protein